jgi:S1-C subfamily serine protease
MPFRATFLSLIVVPALAQFAFGQTRIEPSLLYKSASPAVVLIEALGPDGKAVKAGSGFVVAPNGKILTNYHVISHAKQATIRLENGDAYDTVEVIAVDKRRDIAFLKIPAVDLPSLKLGRSNSVEVGETAYSIGTPLGFLQNTLSEGLVSGIRDMDGYHVFQITAPISHGSSGGPIFNGKGEVIGIAVMTVDGGQNLNFAIPIDYARGMLEMSQTQSLAAIYEPEPPADLSAAPSQPLPAQAAPAPTSATLGSAVPSTSTPSPAAQGASAVPEEMRKGSFAFLESKLGHWGLADAKAVLGEPVQQRPAYNGPNVDGVIYAFLDPTHSVRQFELNFSNTGILRAFYAYPVGATLKQAQALWGRDYKETKNANGTRGFSYNKRHLLMFTDKDGNILNIGIYL